MSWKEAALVFGAEYLVYVQAIVTLVFAWVRRRTLRATFAAYAITSGVAAFALSRLAGLLYNNPRPFVVEGFTPPVPHAPDNGFPSDHTLLAAWLAALVFPYDRRLGTILGVGALLVGFFRVAAGVHHLVDIVASLVIVAVAAFVAWRISLVIARRP
jgi:undecaprenyl-diphosphatase